MTHHPHRYVTESTWTCGHSEPHSGKRNRQTETLKTTIVPDIVQERIAALIERALQYLIEKLNIIDSNL